MEASACARKLRLRLRLRIICWLECLRRFLVSSLFGSSFYYSNLSIVLTILGTIPFLKQ